jgi:hypothetical protein
MITAYSIKGTIKYIEKIEMIIGVRLDKSFFGVEGKRPCQANL